MALNTASVIPGRIDQPTVECLQDLLAMAKRGEIVGLVYGAAKGNREIRYGSVGGPDFWMLIAAADLAHRDIMELALRGC